MVVVEALMNYEAGARASILPFQAPSPLGKRPRNLARSPLQVGCRWKKSGRRQKSTVSEKLSRFYPGVVAQKGSALRQLVDDRTALHPRRIWCLLIQQYVQQHACACYGTLAGFPRQDRLPLACNTLPKDTILAFGRNAPGGEVMISYWRSEEMRLVKS